MDLKTANILNIIPVFIFILYVGYLIVLKFIDAKKDFKLPVSLGLLIIPMFICLFAIRGTAIAQQKELYKQLDGQEAVKIEKKYLYVTDGEEKVRILTGRLPEFVYTSSGTIHAKDGVLYICGENPHACVWHESRISLV